MDNTSELHPLRRSSTTRTGTGRYDTGSTRPRLSRVLSPSTPALAGPGSPPNKAESLRTVLVHVHEVSPNDSLAGVALKYGISVTELRRANQLWASDSIHLRQVLYIPLEKARHANLTTPGSESSSIVQRIPTTTLSFFPPPSSSSSTSASSHPTTMSAITTFRSHHHSSATLSAPSKGSNLTSTLRANALSSLFSVLPINASTRDEIMSRLSIDSVSNSTTGTASDEAEHELTAVPTTLKQRTSTSMSMAIPTPFMKSQGKSPAYTWLTDSSKADSREPYSTDVEQIPLASSPIHTTQMQPAAAMQLPGHIGRSPPKAPPPNDSHNSAWRLSSDHPRIR
ncbi:hypothetical protein B0F90DRAFT_1815027 [Multifurca ochricompacta]|uniref:LysM domain-containing protein n=1 Tax=Multifurca ochricompacta TaxID=376703 RepID=A0AAD4QQN0_9AGAM|nr:hypothetical protein B0F90DRAFT_1815027 [Multifurca ochricompacta]